MKGYLHNLVMRSLGVAETVQPRLASLFEPPATTPFVPHQELRERAAAPEGYEDESAAPLSPAEAQRQAPLQRAREATPPSTSPVEAGQPSSESERTVAPRVAVQKPQQFEATPAEAARETSETVVAPPLPPATPKREAQGARAGTPALKEPDTFAERSDAPPHSLIAQAALMASAPLPAETVRVPERVTLAPPVQPGRDAVEAAPSTAEAANGHAASREETAITPAHPLREETRTLVKEVSHETAARELLMEKPQAVPPLEPATIREVVRERPVPHQLRPQVSHQSTERKTLSNQAPAPRAEAPEPVIHVTIGRIEVRAVTRAERPQGRAAPKPAESLEDYLRQRAKGGSR